MHSSSRRSNSNEAGVKSLKRQYNSSLAPVYVKRAAPPDNPYARSQKGPKYTAERTHSPQLISPLLQSQRLTRTEVKCLEIQSEAALRLYHSTAVENVVTGIIAMESTIPTLLNFSSIYLDPTRIRVLLLHLCAIIAVPLPATSKFQKLKAYKQLRTQSRSGKDRGIRKCYTFEIISRPRLQKRRLRGGAGITYGTEGLKWRKNLLRHGLAYGLACPV